MVRRENLIRRVVNAPSTQNLFLFSFSFFIFRYYLSKNLLCDHPLTNLIIFTLTIHDMFIQDNEDKKDVLVSRKLMFVSFFLT